MKKAKRKRLPKLEDKIYLVTDECFWQKEPPANYNPLDPKRTPHYISLIDIQTGSVTKLESGSQIKIVKAVKKMKSILVTGGSGFIGHHFVDYILKKTDWNITLLERLAFSGNLNRISDLESYKAAPERVKFVHHDLRSPINEYVGRDLGTPEYIVHFAASTHVDRAMVDPTPFYMDNVVGTSHLIEWAKKLPKDSLKLMINFSTDEVFGTAEVGVYHKEGDPFNPSNDYAAAKAGQEMVARAAFNAHKFPVINTHTMNNFGERQHAEKFLPKTIRKIFEGKPMPIYADVNADGSVDKKNVGSRVWMYTENTADALFFLLEKGVAGEDYNIIGFDEHDILTLAEKVSNIVGKPLIPEFVGFYGARPGHDRRYALDGSKLKEMGWTPPNNFEQSLKKTVDFALNNPRWI